MRGGHNKRKVYIYENNTLVRTHPGIAKTARAEKIGEKTLYKIFDTGRIYRGYEWRLTEKIIEPITKSKLSWIQRIWHNLMN